MPCPPNDLGTIAPFTRVSVAQAFADRRQRENDACAERRHTQEAPKTRKRRRRVFEFDVWNVRAHQNAKNAIAHPPSIGNRAALSRWHRQECLCYLRAIHRPLKTISTGVRVATGFPYTSVADLNLQRFTAVIA